MGRLIRDLTKEPPFGRLTALELAPYNGHHRRWVCLCECGIQKTIDQSKLTSGHTQSCGCLRSEATSSFNSETKSTHRLSGTPIYAVWRGMLARCFNESHLSYASYGGRGIQVCARWQDSFEEFLVDMGIPKPGQEIDRIDNNGHYEPSNCKWASAKQNTRNRRVTPRFTFNGETKALGDFSDQCGIPYVVLKDRIRRGWSINRAVTTSYTGRIAS